MSLKELSFEHKNTIDVSDIDRLADEGKQIISDLEEEIEALEYEQSELEEDTEENGTDNTVRLSEIEKAIETKQNTVKVYQSDVDHLDNVYSTISNYSDTAIQDSHLKDYIEDKQREIYCEELNALPDLIAGHIDWTGIVSDCEADYSSVEFDGFTYHFD